MQTTAEYFCPFCGEANTIFIDITGGMEQSYIEDCQVCCHPNILYIRIDEDTLDIAIDTDYEN
jgi:Cysteine-rich CPXCG